MWLATKHGFFSIIRHSETEWYVRGRVMQDLENLRALMEWPGSVQRWPSADYRYRLIITRDQLTALFITLAEDIDYGNFKSMIAKRPDQEAKLESYHRSGAS